RHRYFFSGPVPQSRGRAQHHESRRIYISVSTVLVDISKRVDESTATIRSSGLIYIVCAMMISSLVVTTLVTILRTAAPCRADESGGVEEEKQEEGGEEARTQEHRQVVTHRSEENIEFFVKIGIGCVVIMGFILWWGWLACHKKRAAARRTTSSRSIMSMSSSDSSPVKWTGELGGQDLDNQETAEVINPFYRTNNHGINNHGRSSPPVSGRPSPVGGDDVSALGQPIQRWTAHELWRARYEHKEADASGGRPNGVLDRGSGR
ncbi:unnamed protein product, partial [Discosporangium mesarthrocarpum]